jgi:hypothetical protein
MGERKQAKTSENKRKQAMARRGAWFRSSQLKRRYPFIFRLTHLRGEGEEGERGPPEEEEEKGRETSPERRWGVAPNPVVGVSLRAPKEKVLS